MRAGEHCGKAKLRRSWCSNKEWQEPALKQTTLNAALFLVDDGVIIMEILFVDNEIIHSVTGQ